MLLLLLVWHNILGTAYPNPGMAAPDTFTMVLDLEAGTLAFSANNTYLGTAFSGLKGPLFPVVSGTWGYSEVALVYRFNSAHVDAALYLPLRRGGLAAEPLSLQELAREQLWWHWMGEVSAILACLLEFAGYNLLFYCKFLLAAERLAGF